MADLVVDVYWFPLCFHLVLKEVEIGDLECLNLFYLYFSVRPLLQLRTTFVDFVDCFYVGISIFEKGITVLVLFNKVLFIFC